jgi:glutaminase
MVVTVTVDGRTLSLMDPDTYFTLQSTSNVPQSALCYTLILSQYTINGIIGTWRLYALINF